MEGISWGGIWQSGNYGGYMSFGSDVHFQFQYSDNQIQGLEIDENSIVVKYWNDQSNSWIEVSNAEIDIINNKITYSETDVSNFIILLTDQVTSVERSENLFKEGFSLKQNYPNLFNPKTSIKFTIPTANFVSLMIYEILGNEVITLLNEEKEAGTYKLDFDTTNLSSGFYFHKIEAGMFVTTKKLILLK